MAENDSKMGIILVIPTNLEKIKVLMIAANLLRPFSTPNAVALQRKRTQCKSSMREDSAKMFITA